MFRSVKSGTDHLGSSCRSLPVGVNASTSFNEPRVRRQVKIVRAKWGSSPLPLKPHEGENWLKNLKSTASCDCRSFTGVASPIIVQRRRRLCIRQYDHDGKETAGHALRHSSRAWLGEKGTGPEVQKELMRHSSIVMTVDGYGRGVADCNRMASAVVVSDVLQ